MSIYMQKFFYSIPYSLPTDSKSFRTKCGASIFMTKESRPVLICSVKKSALPCDAYALFFVSFQSNKRKFSI